MSVYVPTTPNPTSGFFLLVPVADVIELDMSVDEALTYVISMGAVSPAVLSTELTMDMKSGERITVDWSLKHYKVNPCLCVVGSTVVVTMAV